MKLLAALLLLTIVANANAQKRPDTVYMHASELIRSCKEIAVIDQTFTGDTIDATTDLSLCIGYVIGVVDGATDASARNANGRFPVCIPTEATREELLRVVLKYADAHPEKLHYPADRFVIEALGSGFPCSG